jgi:hypothetical protein
MDFLALDVPSLTEWRFAIRGEHRKALEKSTHFTDSTFSSSFSLSLVCFNCVERNRGRERLGL